MRTRGHLRKVGDAQHLTHFAQATHQPANQFSDRAADAAVGLIEDEGSNRLGSRGRDRNRQTHSGQFAARSDFGQWSGRTRAVPGNLELDAFGPRGAGVC